MPGRLAGAWKVLSVLSLGPGEPAMCTRYVVHVPAHTGEYFAVSSNQHVVTRHQPRHHGHHVSVDISSDG